MIAIALLIAFALGFAGGVVATRRRFHVARSASASKAAATRRHRRAVAALSENAGGAE